MAGMHLSRPMYEGLPWLYIGAGVAALGVSYLIGDSHVVGLLVGLAGPGGSPGRRGGAPQAPRLLVRCAPSTASPI